MVEPLVYVDSCIFINVIRREAALWPDSLKVLMAAHRGDIRLVASTLLLVELNGQKRSDESDFRTARDKLVNQYLDSLDVEWVEVDHITAREARQVSERHRLLGADAAHLATAIRRDADYFISRDSQFPYGTTVGARTKVVQPTVLWNPTTDDIAVDQEAARESS
ncbi:PIN domain-containing protein [Streptomyces sp. FIT100]|uniref:type II toxin-antitoxin system VapC family toxin n=1 Tax=Streptomyces sp. FIT100 TaxID=2837956 RepID=UPI0021CA07D3|nr:PIN domain-containing protein [Streptomyces sp. FIT100]UUN28586.1 PIN domain-containing protein [Streptomyces sp. FIT100]